MRLPTAILLLVLMALASETNAEGRRRAVLVGINDYSASAFPRPRKLPPDRDWRDLAGAVNDVQAMREMLRSAYGFDAKDIVTLTDQQATRAAILQAIDRHLLDAAAKGDVLFFYFAGHGSQVRNSRSEETDRMDESLVPADSRAGVDDIRDKELRPRFNAILEKGARLTVILDKCHSGSGARGGARARGVKPDMRDVADRAPWGPRPENRGALILAATQDFDPAWETTDGSGTIHGTFSWALLRAMRDTLAGESASETFLRARARMRAETPFQEPVMAGDGNARGAPLLGTSADRRGDRTVVTVERVKDDGTVVLQGGRASGLAIGTELRAVNPRDPSQLRITAMLGLGRSEARVEKGAVRSGALLEVAREPGDRIRMWQRLESPQPSPFQLGVRHVRSGAFAKDVVLGGERYELVLRRAAASSHKASPRYVYVFVIDSQGTSTLLFPRSGSVENRFESAGADIALGTDAAFAVAEPYGRDTYILLTTDEALANPWVLQWEGTRSGAPAMPANWSLQRVVFESVRHKSPAPVSQ